MLDSIKSAFSHLPGSQEGPFGYLWERGRLSFGPKDDRPDVIDELNARLVAAALVGRKRIFLLLPDCLPQRPAFLLATALISYRPIQGKESRNSEVVLYCGSTVGI